MFAANHFYHGLIRKYLIVFGNFFNDITVTREDAQQNRLQTLKVPLTYGPHQKVLKPFTADERIDQKVAVQLPRLGFEINGLSRVSARQPIKTIKNVFQDPNDKNQLRFQYIGVPYDMGVSLSLYVENDDDGVQILEQILPFFAPEWTIDVITIPEMGYKTDVVIELRDVSVSDSYEAQLAQRRVLIWTLQFNMQIKLFGPVNRSGLIKRVQLDFHAVPGSGPVTNEEILKSGRSSRYVLVPGLTANGQPTTNAAASIHYTKIEEDDNWGFAETFSFFTDGKKYDPVTGKDVDIE